MKKYVDKIKRQIYTQNLTFYGLLNLNNETELIGQNNNFEPTLRLYTFAIAKAFSIYACIKYIHSYNTFQTLVIQFSSTVLSWNLSLVIHSTNFRNTDFRWFVELYTAHVYQHTNTPTCANKPGSKNITFWRGNKFKRIHLCTVVRNK